MRGKVTTNRRVVLPQQPRLDASTQLREIVAELKQRPARGRALRGRGVGILFSGGTAAAKTKAAEALAHGLGLGLQRVDLAAIVSKFIGETEKNLDRAFAAAKAGGAILFFDEADALFGKRTQVKDSHDRFAVVERDYLLQLTEAAGVTILAIKAATRPSPVVLRRLRYVVRFAGKRRAA
jgi:SpoVK/Ycf46/Vps4 family AAA+-type ATPase